MFDNLTDSLQSTFKNITGRGTLTESNIREAMEEVRIALLDADVSYGIVQDFIEEAISVVGSGITGGTGCRGSFANIVDQPFYVARAVRYDGYGIDLVVDQGGR